MLLIRDVDSILTLDARRRILERHSVLIDGGKILRMGDAATLDRDHLETVRDTGRIIEGSGCVMLPAHVNTHVHTVEHLSRGLIPDDLATFDWASLYATPFCASLTEEEAYVSARLACLEMISNGTGTFVDCNVLASLGHLDAVAQAVEESGMRAVLGRGVTDILPPAKQTMPEVLQAAVWHPSTEAALAEVDALLSRGAERAQGRIRLWASIYGLMFFTSDALFRGIRTLADRHGAPVAFHIASSREEAALSESRTGEWPIGHLDRLDVLREDMLLTHCTLVTDEEVSRLADRGTKVAYCPGAALRLAKGTTQVGKIPEMPRSRRHGVPGGGRRVLQRHFRPLASCISRCRSVQGCAHGSDPGAGRDRFGDAHHRGSQGGAGGRFSRLHGGRKARGPHALRHQRSRVGAGP